MLNIQAYPILSNYFKWILFKFPPQPLLLHPIYTTYINILFFVKYRGEGRYTDIDIVIFLLSTTSISLLLGVGWTRWKGYWWSSHWRMNWLYWLFGKLLWQNNCILFLWIKSPPNMPTLQSFLCSGLFGKYYHLQEPILEYTFSIFDQHVLSLTKLSWRTI